MEQKTIFAAVTLTACTLLFFFGQTVLWILLALLHLVDSLSICLCLVNCLLGVAVFFWMRVRFSIWMISAVAYLLILLLVLHASAAITSVVSLSLSFGCLLLCALVAVKYEDADPAVHRKKVSW